MRWRITSITLTVSLALAGGMPPAHAGGQKGHGAPCAAEKRKGGPKASGVALRLQGKGCGRQAAAGVFPGPKVAGGTGAGRAEPRAPVDGGPAHLGRIGRGALDAKRIGPGRRLAKEAGSAAGLLRTGKGQRRAGPFAAGSRAGAVTEARKALGGGRAAAGRRPRPAAGLSAADALRRGKGPKRGPSGVRGRGWAMDGPGETGARILGAGFQAAGEGAAAAVVTPGGGPGAALPSAVVSFFIGSGKQAYHEYWQGEERLERAPHFGGDGRGNTVAFSKDGRTSVVYHRDGTEEVRRVNADGSMSREYRNPDEPPRSEAIAPDFRYEGTDPDGTHRYRRDDGTVALARPDGSVVFVGRGDDGKTVVMVVDRDGNATVQEYEGFPAGGQGDGSKGAGDTSGGSRADEGSGSGSGSAQPEDGDGDGGSASGGGSGEGSDDGSSGDDASGDDGSGGDSDDGSDDGGSSDGSDGAQGTDAGSEGGMPRPECGGGPAYSGRPGEGCTEVAVDLPLGEEEEEAEADPRLTGEWTGQPPPDRAGGSGSGCDGRDDPYTGECEKPRGGPGWAVDPGDPALGVDRRPADGGGAARLEAIDWAVDPDEGF